jgi:hypothetical protein
MTDFSDSTNIFLPPGGPEFDANGSMLPGTDTTLC